MTQGQGARSKVHGAERATERGSEVKLRIKNYGSLQLDVAVFSSVEHAAWRICDLRIYRILNSEYRSAAKITTEASGPDIEGKKTKDKSKKTKVKW